MSATICKVLIIGNVGNDPDIRTMNSGDKVANLSVATSEKWKDKSTGEQKEKTEWHRVVVFGKLADIVERYVKKGSKVYIEGKLQTRKWTDQSGVDKYTTEIVLQGYNCTLNMLDSPSGQSQSPAPMSTQEALNSPSDFSEDEIPF